MGSSNRLKLAGIRITATLTAIGQGRAGQAAGGCSKKRSKADWAKTAAVHPNSVLFRLVAVSLLQYLNMGQLIWDISLLSLNTEHGGIMVSHSLVSRPGCHDPTPGEEERKERFEE